MQHNTGATYDLIEEYVGSQILVLGDLGPHHLPSFDKKALLKEKASDKSHISLLTAWHEVTFYRNNES